MDSSALTRQSLMRQMASLQAQNPKLLLRAEALKNGQDLKPAAAAYEELIAVNRQLLELTLAYNARFQPPFEVPTVVQPLINALFVQSDILESMGDRDRPEPLREEAVALARQHLGAAGAADAERARAASLIGEARFNEALVALSNARDAFEQAGDVIKLARTAIDLADVLQWLGDYQRALAEVQRAAAAAAPLLAGQSRRNRSFLQSILDNTELKRIAVEVEYYQGLIEKQLGHYDEADKHFKTVLPEYQKLGVGPAIEFQLDVDLCRRGEYGPALAAFKRLEPNFKGKGLLRAKLATLLKYEAEALLGLGRGSEALAAVQTAQQELDQHYDPDLKWKLEWLHAQVLQTLGKKKEALETYVAAANSANYLRKAPLGYRLDSTFVADKLPLFREAIALALQAQDGRSCCELMEMVKSRLLASALSIPSARPTRQGQPGDKEFDELTRQLDALEYGGYQNGWSDDLQKQRKALIDRRAELLERIRFSDPRWRSLTAPVPFNLDGVLKILAGRGQAAISLFYAGEQVTAVLLQDGKVSVAAQPVSPDTAAALEKYAANLQSESFNPDWFDFSASSGAQADMLIPRALLAAAVQARQLVFVPHGLLHLLPWAGLTFDGKRLFEYLPVGVLPNLGCILNLDEPVGAARAALLGAPDYSALPNISPLPLAAAELQGLCDAYAAAGKLLAPPLTGRDATEPNFWKLVAGDNAQGAILHLACHGTFESEDPMNSGLLLSDSKVDAAELARGRLAFDEVVLSACSTGYRPTAVAGVELAGDDILGLPGALLEAGVRSVLVSIPKAADDATYSFMLKYHLARIGGKSPLAALQETQQAMLGEAVYPPHAWIGLTAYGCQ